MRNFLLEVKSHFQGKDKKLSFSLKHEKLINKLQSLAIKGLIFDVLSFLVIALFFPRSMPLFVAWINVLCLTTVLGGVSFQMLSNIKCDKIINALDAQTWLKQNLKLKEL